MKKLMIALLSVLCFLSLNSSALAFDLNDWNRLPGKQVRVNMNDKSGCVSYDGERECLYNKNGSKSTRSRTVSTVKNEPDVYRAEDLKKHGNSWEVVVDNDPSWAKKETLDQRLERMQTIDDMLN